MFLFRYESFTQPHTSTTPTHTHTHIPNSTRHLSSSRPEINFIRLYRRIQQGVEGEQREGRSSLMSRRGRQTLQKQFDVFKVTARRENWRRKSSWITNKSFNRFFKSPQQFVIKTHLSNTADVVRLCCSNRWTWFRCSPAASCVHTSAASTHFLSPDNWELLQIWEQIYDESSELCEHLCRNPTEHWVWFHMNPVRGPEPAHEHECVSHEQSYTH